MTRKRRNLSKATIAERFRHCGGRCEGTLPDGSTCGVVLRPRLYHADHDIPDALGGEPTFENARCLCLPCHDLKTNGTDKPTIAKAKRVDGKHLAPRQHPKRAIQSRGFEKVERAPKRPVKTYQGPRRSMFV